MDAGKGSNRRPCFLTAAAENLQWKFAYGKISKEEYWKQRKKLEAEKKWWKQM